MAGFEHQRHKPATELAAPRELVVVCAPMRSNANLSGIARTASASGVERLILCGNAKLIPKVARDAIGQLDTEVHRTLLPVLRSLRGDGYRLVGLEQATNSQSLHEYRFARRVALVVGNERLGLGPEILEVLDDVVEIPVFGRPHSYNVSAATAMALYEFCRQYPRG